MNKVRLFSLFLLSAMLFSFANVSPAHAAPGLPVAQWVADDWTGGTANWVDRVSGKVATISAAANSPNKTPGAIVGTETSSGIVFDGVNDYFALAPGQNPIQGATSVTIAAFFNTTQGASGADGAFWRYPGPINGEAPGGPNDWGLTYNAAGDAQGFFNSQINPSPAVSLIDGQSHTMILTWQTPEKVARLYVDGVLAGSTSTSTAGGVNNGNGLVFGAEMEGAILGFSNPRFFSGAIGELRFYDSIEDPATIHGEMLGALTTAATSLALPGDATLNGVGYPGGITTDAYFTYGTDPTFTTGTTDTAPQAIGNGVAGVPVSQPLTGLALDTRYYFRMVITNASGTLFGATRSFFLGPETNVQQPFGTSLVDEVSTVDFGYGAVGFPSTKTFTVANSGGFDLTGLVVSVDGVNAGEFVVDALGATMLASGASTTFEVTFTPAAVGARSAAIHIASNMVGSENPFDIALTGTGVIATIWTGPNITFAKADYVNPSLEANQDRLTSDVWLTRGDYQGIYNAATESGYSGFSTIGSSPADTEWAYGMTANLGALTFQPWAQWHGGCPPCSLNQDAVLHLVSENIYIDIKFTSWAGGFDGGGSFSYIRSTPVSNNNNLPPTAVAGGPYLVAVGQDVTFDGSGSSDPDPADILTEMWTADGGTVSGSTYTAGSVPGIYDVQLTVNDGKENSQPATTMVVVYDPSGGFVTGGGWIDSPEGAYKADPSMAGKANFGFVAKYKNGANVPDGNTQFQFKAGDLNFHSSSYEWLVVAGDTAMFRGEGTINGEGSYTFMISADDDNPDTFRIQIWGDSGTVYDNGSQQALGGGSIKIHNGN